MKHRKGAQDKKRNQLFSKICREVTVAASLGGGILENNPRLKAAVTLAKKNSVPSKNIDNAIKKGTGEIEGGKYEEVTYEGYGPNGIAVFLETSTDNKNRTVSDVRARFTKSGGSLGANGSVDWMFERKGLITIEASHYEIEDDLFELVIEAGGEDLKREGDHYQVFTAFEELFHVKDALEKLSVTIDAAEVTRVPQNITEITDEETTLKVLRLIDQLEELDDVMKVFANFDVSDELVEAVADRV